MAKKKGKSKIKKHSKKRNYNEMIQENKKINNPPSLKEGEDKKEKINVRL